MYFQNIIGKIAGRLKIFASDKSRSNKIKGHNYGQIVQTNGDGDVNIAFGESAEDKAMRIFSAAIEDLRYNGPRIGTPSIPFRLDGIDELLYYAGKYSLSEEGKQRFREYLRTASICNRSLCFVSGQIHNKGPVLIQFLTEHMKNKGLVN